MPNVSCFDSWETILWGPASCPLFCLPSVGPLSPRMLITERYITQPHKSPHHVVAGQLTTVSTAQIICNGGWPWSFWFPYHLSLDKGLPEVSSIHVLFIHWGSCVASPDLNKDVSNGNSRKHYFVSCKRRVLDEIIMEAVAPQRNRDWFTFIQGDSFRLYYWYYRLDFLLRQFWELETCTEPIVQVTKEELDCDRQAARPTWNRCLFGSSSIQADMEYLEESLCAGFASKVFVWRFDCPDPVIQP